MNILSENLKRFRLEKNFTQEEVAGILNVNPQTVSRWECGTTMPDVMLLPQIAEICAKLEKYDEALELYAKAGELGTDFHDEIEGIAFCYEKMGEYEKELAQWLKLQKLYKSEGYEYEAEIYSERIEELKRLLGNN